MGLLPVRLAIDHGSQGKDLVREIDAVRTFQGPIVGATMTDSGLLEDSSVL